MAKNKPAPEVDAEEEKAKELEIVSLKRDGPRIIVVLKDSAGAELVGAITLI